MNLDVFKNKLRTNPKAIKFSETMSTIETYYDFTPTAFKNGPLYNVTGENSGSCKLFAFAKDQNFTKQDTLVCFGKYYEDVLNDPNGKGHQNIRHFINTGFDGLDFENTPLNKK